MTRFHHMGLNALLHAATLFCACRASFVARDVPGVPPQVSLSQVDDLPEFGEKDVTFVLFTASRPIADEGANNDAHSSAELEWWTYPFVANAALMAFREQVVLEDGPALWSGYNFRFVFADTCPDGPGSQRCENVYALQSVLTRFQETAGHPLPRAVIGGNFYGKPVAQLMSAMGVPTVGFWMGEPSLDDKFEYPYFLRTYGGYGLVYSALVDMMVFFNYTRGLMWHGTDSQNLESRGRALELTAQQGITLDTIAYSAGANEFYPPEPDSEQGLEWAASLERAKTSNAHCFLYTAVGSDPWLSFHLWLHWKGLFGPGYLWIQEFPVVNWWFRVYHSVLLFAPDSPYADERGYDGMLSVDIDSFGPKWQTWHDYVASLENRTDEMEPWIIEKVKYQPGVFNQQPEDYPVLAHLLFDAIYATLWAANDLILEHGDASFTNAELLERIWNSDFEASGGSLTFDPETGGRSSEVKVEQQHPPCYANGTRKPAPDLGELVHVGTYTIDRSRPQKEWLQITADLLFYGCATSPPPDKDLPCEPGTYYDRQQGQCHQCAVGYFSDTVGQSACSACREGEFTNITGQDRCERCLAGKYAPSRGLTQCLDCPPGSYQGEVEQSECRLCEPGKNSSVSGSSHCEDCTLGSYQPERGAVQCVPCSTDRSTQYPGASSQELCACPENYLDLDGHCLQCTDGMDCSFGAALANWEAFRTGEEYVGTYPKLLPGYWSPDSDILNVFKCEDIYRCPGGDPGTCSPGLKGRSCTKCPDSQWWNGYECRVCKVGTSDSWMFPYIPLFATPICIIILYFLDDGDVNSWRTWMSSIACFGFVLLNHIQVITLLNQANFLRPPDTAEDTSEIWEFTVDWLSLFKLECAGYAGISNEMVLRTCAPMLLLAWACVLYAAFKVFSLLTRKPEYHMSGARIFDVLMSIIFSFFTAIVAMSLLLYKCEDNPNGTSSLKADKAVLCYEEGTWQDLLALSICAVIFYCGGMSALIIWAILQARIHFRNIEFQKQWKFLFIRYRLCTWWWSISYLSKNVLFNLALVITFSGLGQLYIMMGIICVYMVLVITFMPYRVQTANYLEIFTCLSAIGTASVFTHFVENTAKHVNTMDTLGTTLILIPFPVAVAYISHVLFIQIRKLLRQLSGQSTKDALFSRLFTASAALVALTPDEVSEFLDRVDEPDRHAIKEALIIIESEVIGTPHSRLTLGHATLEPSRLEGIVSEAVRGKGYNVRLSGRQSRVSFRSTKEGKDRAERDEESVPKAPSPVGSPPQSPSSPTSPMKQIDSNELGPVTKETPFGEVVSFI